MINNLKLGVKILRYAYGVKVSLFSGFLFFLVAAANVGIEVMGNNTMSHNIMLGGVMLACAVLMSVQLIHSLNASNLIQSSPQKKRMQTSIPALISVGGMGVMYLLYAFVCCLVGLWHPECRAEMGNWLIPVALLMMILMLYAGVAYKYFLAASLVLYPILYALIYMRMSNAVALSFLRLDTVPGTAAFFIGLALVAAGGFAQYLLSLAVYKAPMSKMAQMAPLRREI